MRPDARRPILLCTCFCLHPTRRCFFSTSSSRLSATLIRAVSIVTRTLSRSICFQQLLLPHKTLVLAHSLGFCFCLSRSLQYSRTLISSKYLLLCSFSADILLRHPWLPSTGRSLYSNSPCSLYIPRANLHIRLYYTIRTASTTVSNSTRYDV